MVIVAIIAFLKRDGTSVIVLCFVIFFVAFLSLLIWLRDYKVVTDDKHISFYKIFGGKRTFLWSEIKSIDVEKVDTNIKMIGTIIVLSIHAGNTDFDFNIETLGNKKQFMNELISRCAMLNIPINDLTNKNNY